MIDLSVRYYLLRHDRDASWVDNSSSTACDNLSPSVSEQSFDVLGEDEEKLLTQAINVSGAPKEDRYRLQVLDERTRGVALLKKHKKCLKCCLLQTNCICGTLRTLASKCTPGKSRIRWWIWMHHKERCRASNTGKLLLHFFPGSEIFIHGDPEHIENLRARIHASQRESPHTQVAVLYPSASSQSPGELLETTMRLRSPGKSKKHGVDDDDVFKTAVPPKSMMTDGKASSKLTRKIGSEKAHDDDVSYRADEMELKEEKVGSCWAGLIRRGKRKDDGNNESRKSTMTCGRADEKACRKYTEHEDNKKTQNVSLKEMEVGEVGTKNKGYCDSAGGDYHACDNENNENNDNNALPVNWDVIIVDATWRQAKRLISDVPEGIDGKPLPHVRLEPKTLSQFACRRQSQIDRISTVEAAVLLLQELEVHEGTRDAVLEGLKELNRAFYRQGRGIGSKQTTTTRFGNRLPKAAPSS